MNADFWWDAGRHEYLEHNPDECSECSFRWWMGIGWEPATGRIGGLESKEERDTIT